MSFKNRLMTLLPYFTLLLATIGIHIYFFLADTYFTARGGDSIDQYLIFHRFLNDLYLKGEFEWSWEYGLGGDIFGQFIYYYATSLFFWLSLALQVDSITDILQAKFLLSILKGFLSMLFMYLLLRYHNRTKSSSIIGAFIYVGSVFFSKYSLRSDFMADAIVWLPLVILSLERLVDKQKKNLFIFSVFLIAVSNFYFAFITSVFIFVYTLLKYLLVNTHFTIRALFMFYVKISLYYAIGLLLSAISFLPAVYHFLNADRFNKQFQIPFLFDAYYYKNLLYNLFFSVSEMTFPIITLVLFVIGFTIRNREVKLRFIFTLIIILFYLLPVTSSFFNGLSAIQFRWFYLVCFSIALLVPFILDYVIEQEYRFRFLLVGIVGLSFILLKVKSNILDTFVNTFEVMNLILLTLVCAVLFLKSKLPKKVVHVSILFIVTVNIFLNNYVFFTNELGSYEKQKAINDELFNTNGFESKTEKEVIQFIKERDSSFYRIMWKDLKHYNLPMLYHYPGFSAYHSLIPDNISKFIKMEYNTLQFDSPSLFKNLDQRLYLENVLNTKYYIVANTDGFIPFGYKKLKTLTDYTIYENLHSLPIGFMFYQGISRVDFDKLNFSEKDLLLLNAVVTTGNPHRNKLDVFSDARNSKSVLHEGLENFSIHNIKKQENTLIVAKNGYIEIPINIPETDGEILTEIEVRSTDGRQFELNVNGKTYVKREANSTYSYPQDTFVLNLGNNMKQELIKISLSPGEYDLKKLRVTYSSYKDMDKLVKERSAHALRNVEITSSKVSGDIISKRPGVLYTSIPFSTGWKAEIDGEKVKTIELNHAFTGIEIPKGKHHVEFEYHSPYLKEGFFLSIAALLVVIILNVFHNKKLRRKV